MVTRPAPGAPANRLAWLEQVKAVAIAWIILDHLSERIFGFPYISNPDADWPPLATRLAQLEPLHGHGLWDLPVNLFRYLGWAGDQGVALFFIASGFGLTWGLLQRGAAERLPLWGFYGARAQRIYPEWWTVHGLAAAALLVLGREQVLADPRFLLSAIGIRVTPDSLYYLVPAWWYVTCLIQLYLLFPFLWWGLRRYGTTALVTIAAAALLARGIGLLTLTTYLDAWARGACAVTRLPELLFGMWLAAKMHEGGPAWIDALRTGRTRLLCGVAYVSGLLLALTLLGNTVAPLLLGASTFVLLVGSFHSAALRGPLARAGFWLGRHSYALFLIHQAIINGLIPAATPNTTAPRLEWESLASLLVALAATPVIEALASGVPVAVRAGWARPAARWAATIALGLGLGALWVGEALVEHRDPQEVFGWGERPSLQPDATVGWKLKPSRETRLRWECYDYRVSANALGFPGPLYAKSKPEGTLRIMTVGDAFTSAEGVDTPQAWPRLLESRLREQLGRPVEVMNFAITGYGPNQYAAVVETFAPRYRPDLILVGMFVNDLDDVLESRDDFQESIGFGRPAAHGWLAFLTAAHLRRAVGLRLQDWATEKLRHLPGPHGYFLGQFAALEPQPRAEDEKRSGRVRERLQQINGVARQIGATVKLLLIPAPAQICGPDALAYYPDNVDLHDTDNFHLDRPQRLLQQVANELSLPTIDLRPTLQAAATCPYFTCNLHWTADGHRLVADAVATSLREQR